MSITKISPQDPDVDRPLSKRIEMAGKKDAQSVVGRWWWREEPDEARKTILANLDLWIVRQRNRIVQYTRNARLYGNMPVASAYGVGVGRLATLRNLIGARLTWNICQSTCDTLTAKITRNKPRPYAVPENGDFKARRTADNQNRFIQGLFAQCKTYEKSRQVTLHSTVFGDGIGHVYAMDGEVNHELVDPAELWLNDVEAALQMPTQIYRVKHITRAKALEMFPPDDYPGSEKIIATAAKIEKLDPNFAESETDLITMVEAFHPSSKKGKDDGRHIIVFTSGAMTKNEVYKKVRYPFSRLRYTELPFGYWSQALIDLELGSQAEINSLLRVVQRSMQLAGTFKYWIEAGDTLSVDHLNNELGLVLRSLKEPKVLTPTIVQPEIYQQLDRLFSKAFLIAGISQLDAGAQKPAGLDAGVALREYRDIGTERFARFGQNYEDWFCDMAELSIDAVGDAMEQKGEDSYKVQAMKSGALFELDWKDLQRKTSPFKVQVWPVAQLPSTPEGKLQTITEYAEAGYLNEEQAQDALNVPDLGKVQTLESAQREWITERIESICMGEPYRPPDPVMAIPIATELIFKYIALAETKHLPNSVLSNLRTWMTELKALAAQAMPPPSPMLAGGAPTGVPTAPPVSQLLPNVPAPAAVQ